MLGPGLGDNLHVVGSKHLALHPADCLQLLPAPAEQPGSRPLEADVLRVQGGLYQGRGERGERGDPLLEAAGGIWKRTRLNMKLWINFQNPPRSSFLKITQNT